MGTLRLRNTEPPLIPHPPLQGSGVCLPTGQRTWEGSVSIFSSDPEERGVPDFTPLPPPSLMAVTAAAHLSRPDPRQPLVSFLTFSGHWFLEPMFPLGS